MPHVSAELKNEHRDGFSAELFLAVILTMVVTCFNPLTRYFFAQDDFTLILRASSDASGMLSGFFGPDPGQFRPLTKTLYFKAMYTVFDLRATPYHIVSLILHMINVALVFALMRRLRVAPPSALVVTSLFALSTAFFHILAWISCVQQLAAMTFVLLALWFGVDAVRTGRTRARWISAVAYVLALACLEQSFLTPLALFAAGAFGIGTGERVPPRLLVRRLMPHMAALLTYAAFMLFWKGIPSEGVYRFQLGSNVAINLLQYMKWLFGYWILLPPIMTATRLPWSVLHVFALYVIAYNLTRRRFGETVFGLGLTVLLLLPVVMLDQHTFLLHTYLPSLGTLYLIGRVVDDVFTLPGLRRDIVRIGVLTGVLAGIFALSFVRVRENIRSTMPRSKAYPLSFVLRRAKIARQVQVDLTAKITDPKNVREIFMVYGRVEGNDQARWNYDNVVEGLARGDAIKLFFEDPGLDVHFNVVGDSLQPVDEEAARVVYFGDYGNCYMPGEESSGQSESVSPGR